MIALHIQDITDNMILNIMLTVNITKHMKCCYNNNIQLPTPPFVRSVSAKECGRRAREGVRDEKW